MKRYFTSSIKWISYEDGGRKKLPPKGIRYCPLLRINHNDDFEDWSIDFICSDYAKTDIIEFKFLVDDAPYELIEVSEEYDVYEGSKKVAQVKIIDCLFEL